MKTLTTIFLMLAFGAAGHAASLKQVENDVKQEGDSVSTGADSRGELTTARGTVRVGSKTSVALRENESQLDLERGVMLVSSDKAGFGREKITVNTPFAQVEAKATMMITYQPGRYIKIACIEGKVTVNLKSLAKDAVTIRAGQLLIIHCLENTLPRVFDVDLPSLVGSSPLTGGGFSQLQQIPTTARQPASRRQTNGSTERSTRPKTPNGPLTALAALASGGGGGPAAANALGGPNAQNLRVNACPVGSLDPNCIANRAPAGAGANRQPPGPVVGPQGPGPAGPGPAGGGGPPPPAAAGGGGGPPPPPGGGGGGGGGPPPPGGGAGGGPPPPPPGGGGGGPPPPP